MGEKGEETGDRVAELEEAEEKCEGLMTPYNSSTEGNGKGKVTAGRISSEDMDTVMEIEVQHGTEGEETSRRLMDGKGLRSGTPFLATHGYKTNTENPVGNVQALNEADTLVYLMNHADNKHWWLVEDVK